MGAHRKRIFGAVSPSDVNRSLVPSVVQANIDAAIATIHSSAKKNDQRQPRQWCHYVAMETLILYRDSFYKTSIKNMPVLLRIVDPERL